MYFVSLIAVVTSIAKCIELEPHGMDAATFADPAFDAAVKALFSANNPSIEWTRKRCVGAKWLNMALHHPLGDLPQWLEYDEAKQFAVKNDAVAAEGIALLTAETVLGSSLLGTFCKHIRDASEGCRQDLLDSDFVRKQVLAGPEVDRVRSTRVGFDLAAIAAFLDANNIAHTLEPPSSQSARLDPTPVAAQPSLPTALTPTNIAPTGGIEEEGRPKFSMSRSSSATGLTRQTASG